jgi:hypothetical protein
MHSFCPRALATVVLLVALTAGCSNVTTPLGGMTAADVAEDTGDVSLSDTSLPDGATVSDDATTDGVTDPDAATETSSDAVTDPDATPAGCTAASECADEDACTIDGCSATGACTHEAIPGCTQTVAPCDDKNPCKTGVCDLATRACVPCLTSADCGAGLLCLERKCSASKTCKSDVECKANNQVCDKPIGLCADCVVAADCGDQQACLDHRCIGAKPCKTSKECDLICDTVAGVCVDCETADDCLPGKFCDASHRCQEDLCAKGGCGSSLGYFECRADGGGYNVGVVCSDNDICTDTVCVPGQGCGQKPNTQACDDSNPCTKGDLCAVGLCKGTADTCDDQDLCTSDACDPKAGCQHTALPNSCDDGNPCTDNKCDPKGGCLFVENAAPCNDGNVCTDADLCKAGKCAGTKPLVCDDGNACTDEACDPKAPGGCVFLANSGDCTDGSVCTVGDKCLNGKCIAGAAKTCTDNNPCTVDTCDAAKDCTFPANTALCDDGNACTTDACTPGTGACTHTAIASCCDPKKVFWQEGFDSGLPAGAKISNSNSPSKGWQVYATPWAFTPGSVLYYGDPATLKYSFNNNKGTVTLPEVSLPPGTKRQLRLQIQAKVEACVNYDKITISAEATGKPAKVLWTKSSLPAAQCPQGTNCGQGGSCVKTTGDNWLELVLDLPADLGDKLWIRLDFDAVDDQSNDTLGVLVDDLRILQVCP